MILARFYKSESGEILSVSVSGHAGMAEEGSDIVCAAASALVYTAIGALEELCGFQDYYRIAEDSDGDSVPFTEIRLPESEGKIRETAGIILRTLEIGFKQLELTVNGEFVQAEEIRNVFGGENHDNDEFAAFCS